MKSRRPSGFLHGSTIISTKKLIWVVYCALLGFRSCAEGWLSRIYPRPRGRIGRHCSALKGWCKTASYEDESIIIEECGIREVNGTVYDLSSSRYWLESRPDGAYTVLRCDLLLGKDIGWHVWGYNFHVNRLHETYRLIHGEDATETDVETKTRRIFDVMCDVAQDQLRKDEAGLSDGVYTFMMTVLWYHAESTVVELHACSSGQAVSVLDYNPDPVRAILALSKDRSLPERWSNNPRAKRSSWCTERRPLEVLFKTPDTIGEVILVRNEDDSDDTLLEGLTSNLFVEYPDHELRTPGEGVLRGYARQLVLDAAPDARYRHVEASISIKDAFLWQGVFLTSSIRLIIPVSEILVPMPDGSVETLWHQDDARHGDWKRVYNVMLDHQGLTRQDNA